MNEGAFFQDLAMLMAFAGIAAIVFSRFGLPKVIGYILAGIVMSEHTWGGSFLADAGSASTVGQLGVVFLMFGMGLSFSPREMGRMRSVAMPVALVDTAVMIWLGYTIGTRLFEWEPAQSFFLGVAICDSATTLLAKVLDEMGWGSRPFARYVLGTSVCEDIICVGAIAVATGFVSGGSMSAGAFAMSLFWLGVFFLTVLVFGFILVPRLLKSVAKRGDDESLVITLLGCCFFVSYFAYRFEYSLALGAFLVGIIGGSSGFRDRLERLTSPLKSMFSAMFFVSIGLLVDPHALWRNMPEILFVSAIIVAGKTLNVTAASIAVGVDVKTAVQNGLGLAQTGEFAFMVAILYAGATGNAGSQMISIAVGASLATTVLNPWLIRVSDPIGGFVERAMPEKFRSWLLAYRAWLGKIRASEGSPAFREFRSAAIRLGVYAVLVLSGAIILSLLFKFDYSRFSGFFERHDAEFFFLAVNVFALSFLPLIISASRSLGDSVAILLVGEGDFRWKSPMQQTVRFFVVCGVVALFFVEWTMINIAVAPRTGWAPGVSSAIVAITGILGWRLFVKAGRRATSRFEEALTAQERREGLERTMSIALPEGAFRRFTLGVNSPAIGGTVVTLNIRAKTGASIVAVKRGDVIMRNIGPDLEFRVGDTLAALGEPSQIAALKDLLGVTS